MNGIIYKCVGMNYLFCGMRYKIAKLTMNKTEPSN